MDRLESGLRLALFGVFGLLLVTPFVISTGTVYPFVVGKALWSRALIEIAFALWAVLALTRPGYGPPRSWELVLLGVGLGVSLLSAWSGVSVERMQGVVDQAHWCVLGLVRPRRGARRGAAHAARVARPAGGEHRGRDGPWRAWCSRERPGRRSWSGCPSRTGRAAPARWAIPPTSARTCW